MIANALDLFTAVDGTHLIAFQERMKESCEVLIDKLGAVIVTASGMDGVSLAPALRSGLLPGRLPNDQTM